MAPTPLLQSSIIVAVALAAFLLNAISRIDQDHWRHRQRTSRRVRRFFTVKGEANWLLIFYAVLLSVPASVFVMSTITLADLVSGAQDPLLFAPAVVDALRMLLPACAAIFFATFIVVASTVRRNARDILQEFSLAAQLQNAANAADNPPAA